MAPDTQIAFAQKQGSMPARQDVDSGSLDVCAQKAMAFVADTSKQIPSTELLSPPAVTGAVEDVISGYWNDSSMTTDAFVTKLVAALTQTF
jgi:glucose/mannose transport system substrate-binding protein